MFAFPSFKNTLSLHKKQLGPPYTYKTFGLKIESEIELPELQEKAFSRADISIRWGQNPDNLPNPIKSGAMYQAGRDDFLFRLNSVGSYRVKKGSLITVNRLNEATDEEVRLFLFGSAFGALIHQRGLLALHSSAVVKDGKAYLISGISGAGKSSLAAILMNRNFSFLADDISVIDIEDGNPVVYPGIPHLKLWKDVIKKMGEEDAGFPPVREQILKYRKPAGSEFADKKTHIDKIIILSYKNSSGFEINEIKGADKFNHLKNNTYRLQYLIGLEKTKHHFKLVTQLANTCPMYHVLRPTSPLLLNELADFVEQKLIFE